MGTTIKFAVKKLAGAGREFIFYRWLTWRLCRRAWISIVSCWFSAERRSFLRSMSSNCLPSMSFWVLICSAWCCSWALWDWICSICRDAPPMRAIQLCQGPNQRCEYVKCPFRSVHGGFGCCMNGLAVASRFGCKTTSILRSQPDDISGYISLRFSLSISQNLFWSWVPGEKGDRIVHIGAFFPLQWYGIHAEVPLTLQSQSRPYERWQGSHLDLHILKLFLSFVSDAPSTFTVGNPSFYPAPLLICQLRCIRVSSIGYWPAHLFLLSTLQSMHPLSAGHTSTCMNNVQI